MGCFAWQNLSLKNGHKSRLSLNSTLTSILHVSFKQNLCILSIGYARLCITVKVLRMLARGKTCKPFKCDRGPIFQVTNLNRNLTQFSLQKSNTNQIGLHEMVVWACNNQKMVRTYHKCVLIV